MRADRLQNWPPPADEYFSLIGGADMRKVVLPLALLSGIFADGFFYSAAHAQCSADDKIYIDPRLVPKRPSPSREGFESLMRPGST